MSVHVIVKSNHYAAFAAAVPRMVDNALRELGERMYQMAYELAPELTGALKASLFHELDAPGVLIVGATVLYAAFVEFGTRHMAAQPYLIPAFEAWAYQINALIVAEFERFFH